MKELYNNSDYVAGEQTLLNTFDITYYPQERGPYNVNPANEATSQRWAGLMRPISVTNFITSNIDYVEFWLMDPRADGNNLGTDPKLLLQLGNVSEDVLKDGKLQLKMDCRQQQHRPIPLQPIGGHSRASSLSFMLFHLKETREHNRI
jgi:cell surface protein SprA